MSSPSTPMHSPGEDTLSSDAFPLPNAVTAPTAKDVFTDE